MKRFEGRVAVVTGAASGIGKALAERFAGEGMHVVLADVDAQRLSELASRLQNSKGRVMAVETDVAQRADVERLASLTIAEFGEVHVLCNNAGVGGEFAWTWEQQPETWERAIGVNLTGVIHGLQMFVPPMLEQNSECHVINTSSISGLTSLPFLAPYHATKHAVVTLSESLRFELQMLDAKIGVSVLCPGPVQTPIMEVMPSSPTRLPQRYAAHSLEPRGWHLAWQRLLAGGSPPEAMAAAVLDAVKNDRFYVFPSAEYLEIVRMRMETILGERNPELSLPQEIIELVDEGKTTAAAEVAN